MNLPKNNATAMNALLNTNVSPATKRMLVTKYITSSDLTEDLLSPIDQLIKLTKSIQQVSLAAPKNQVKPAI